MTARTPCRDYPETDASRYVTGEMAGVEARAFQAHAETCPVCRTAVRRQRHLDALIGALPTRPVGGSGTPTLRAGRSRRYRWLPAAAAAIIVALLLADRTPVRHQGVEAAMMADARLVDRIVGSLRDGGRLQTGETQPAPPWLGFAACPRVAPPTPAGVYICALDPESPLARGGVRAGDVLLAIDGVTVRDADSMYRIVASHEVGDTVRVRYRSGPEIGEISAPLVPRRPGPRYPFDLVWSDALKEAATRVEPGEPDLRALFVPLSDTAAARLDVPAGVRVTERLSRSQWNETILIALPYFFRPESGLRAGDVIVGVSGHPVADAVQLFDRLVDVQHGPFTLEVRRGARALELAFDGSTERTHDSEHTEGTRETGGDR